MPLPTGSQLRVDTLLTTMSIAWMNDAKNFVADRFSASLPVDADTGKYAEFSKADFMRIEAQLRGPSSESAGGGFAADLTGAYACKRYAFHKDVPYEDRDKASYDLDKKSVAYVTHGLLLKREQVWADAIVAASTWTGGTGGSTDQTGVNAAPGANQFLQWNDAASTPIDDIDTQKDSILQNTGKIANVLFLGQQVFTRLKRHPDIVDIIKYTQKGIATEDILAEVFGVERVLVGRAVKNTAKEGATASMSFIHGKSAVLAYVASSPAVDEPSGSYNFSFRGYDGGSGGPILRRIDMPLKQAERIEGEIYFQPKVTAPTCGVYFATAVA